MEIFGLTEIGDHKIVGSILMRVFFCAEAKCLDIIQNFRLFIINTVGTKIQEYASADQKNICARLMNTVIQNILAIIRIFRIADHGAHIYTL